jgi:hypothetical protein
VLFPGAGKPILHQQRPAETLGRKFGYFNHYQVCQSGEPYCIYQTSGSTDDWAYGELGVAAYTFELGNYFFEACPDFENEILPANLPALLYALKAARRPYQNPAGPESLQVQVSPAQVNPGTTVALTATADDTRYDSGGWGGEPVQNIAEARYSIDRPSWMSGTTYPLSVVDGNFDNPVEGLQAAVDTAGLSQGRHLIFVESKDADGNWGIPSAAFLDIAEVPYSPDLAPDQSNGQATPGQTANYSLTLTNLGTLSDSFDLQFSGNTWEINAQPDPAGPLNSGESQEISVQVTIPSDASPGRAILPPSPPSPRVTPARLPQPQSPPRRLSRTACADPELRRGSSVSRPQGLLQLQLTNTGALRTNLPPLATMPGRPPSRPRVNRSIQARASP